MDPLIDLETERGTLHYFALNICGSLHFPMAAKSAAVVLAVFASPSALSPVVFEVEGMSESLTHQVTKQSIVDHTSVCVC